MTDVEKFRIIYQSNKFGEYKTQQEFSKLSGIARATLSDWLKKLTTIENISSENQKRLCDFWNLDSAVWDDEYKNEQTFLQSLDRYRKVQKIGKYIVDEREERIVLSNEEDDELARLSKQDIVAIPAHLELLSSDFLFDYARLLKSKNQAYEALLLLNLLEDRKDSFYYYFYAPISHLKAVLLSHESIGKWDEAIIHLQLLYKVLHYHLKEPEILTLLASNFKRKAIYGDKQKPLDKTDVDIDMLNKSLSIYDEAYYHKVALYKQNSPSDFWYDAVNIAYIKKILFALVPHEYDINEVETSIESLKDETLKMWNHDSSNWWDVISHIELLMLAGDIDRADSELELYMNAHKIEPFEISTTRRQLDLFISYTDDINAKTLDAWLKSIEKNI